MNLTGEFAALATAFCWSITATSFEVAGKKVGSQPLNLIRLLIGSIFLMIFTYLTRGLAFPLDASFETWKWLFLSGLVGLVIGDLLLFEAFVRIGARISMLIYASVPPMSGILAYFLLGESMRPTQILGMFVTLTGIAIVILTKDSGNKVKLSHPIAGILLAFGGAFGQALGYIIGKFGLENYDAFAATQIRLVAGIIGFTILFSIRGTWKSFFAAFKEKTAMGFITLGSFFGPFLGISLSLLAIQHTNPGVASTLTSITPVLLIPVAIFVRKEHVSLKETLGAFIAIAGVAIIFLL
ncbi:DMT family transporter [Acidaminobacter sp. JC074]|uniref:DMT family transporter n=1 Tax=Acidaminobacter sp. JC074 TaxID=2530199 RepID=UPI001F0E3BB5|nr:DMT family transporter [Acidaminobacter sp. JC074]MCH4891109.1 DMT family transporter [Acidaminobacter sp. JC074]